MDTIAISTAHRPHCLLAGAHKLQNTKVFTKQRAETVPINQFPTPSDPNTPTRILPVMFHKLHWLP